MKPDPEGWMKEFYPITAAMAAKQGEVAAAEHSLKKWEGAQLKNLRRYGLPEPPIEFYASTCALCHRHNIGTENSEECSGCPLFKVRGEVDCVSRQIGEARSPFNAYQLSFADKRKPSPKPMIRWLRKAVRWAKEQSK